MKKIYLAIIAYDNNNSYSEYHIIYEGHNTVESAYKEIDEIRRRLIRDGKKPFDCYIYEAESPPFNQPEYRLDQIDFNFYREPTPEEKEKLQKIQEQIESSIANYGQ